METSHLPENREKYTPNLNSPTNDQGYKPDHINELHFDNPMSTHIESRMNYQESPKFESVESMFVPKRE